MFITSREEEEEEEEATASLRKHPERASGWMGRNLIKLGPFPTRGLKEDGLIQLEASVRPRADMRSVQSHKKETIMECGM